MSILNNRLSSDSENFKGYDYESNQDSTPSFPAGLQLDGGLTLKSQADGTISFIDADGNVRTLVSLDVTDGSEQAVTKVISNELISENASTAFQPASSITKLSTINNRGRYEIKVDFTIVNETHVERYRSKSNTGLNNIRLQLYKMSNIEPESGSWTEIISNQWWRTKRPVWQTRNRNQVLTETANPTGEYDVTAGNVELGFVEGVTYESHTTYRLIISADNEFDLLGYDQIPDPVRGGFQFFPYIERTYRTVNRLIGDGVVRYDETMQLDVFRDETNTSIIFSNGDVYAVNSICAVETLDGTISIKTIVGEKEIYSGIHFENITINDESIGSDIQSVVNNLNALFSVTQAGVNSAVTSPVVDSVGIATTDSTYSNIIDPVGNGSYALSSGTHGVVYTDEKINENGEYFTFSVVGKNYVGIGLYDDTKDSDNDGTSDHLEELQSQTTNRYLGNQFSMWVHPTVAVWTYYGENTGFSTLEGYSSSDATIRFQTSYEYVNMASQPVGFKVRINEIGYLVVSYWNSSANRYVDLVRTSYILPQANYGLYVALGNSTVQIFDKPKVHLVDQSAPILTYYSVESPDGYFYYPLFKTPDEANYYDTQNGGSGSNHVHVFVDDPSGNQWYMPENYLSMGGSTTPVDNTPTGVTWNIVNTEDDSIHAPPQYVDNIIGVDEFSSINLEIDDQYATWITTLIDKPDWLIFSNGNLSGTAPEVLDNDVNNPSDQFVITIERKYGNNGQFKSYGTLTINVINLTKPIVNAITGFTHEVTSTTLVDGSTLADGSVVSIDETLGNIQRLIINKTYVESNILPNLNSVNDRYIIGNLNNAYDVSTLEISDYDFAIVWEYVDTLSHKFTFYRDGVAGTSNIINSMSLGYYDYAIETQYSDVWLIACNVNAINGEVSPEFGGSFTNSEKITNIENSTPLTISIGNLGSNKTISTQNLSEIIVPRPDTWIQVEHDVSHDFVFEGLENMPTLNAGYTYRFLMENTIYDDQSTLTHLASSDTLHFTHDGITEYTTGITRVGNVGVDGSYIEFQVPSDVPPLFWYNGQAGISTNDAVTISGSSYTVTVTGVTSETGSTPLDGFGAMQEGSWIKTNEQLSAGMRMIFNHNFLIDLRDNMNVNDIVYIGAKASTFVATQDATASGQFRDNDFFYVKKHSDRLEFVGKTDNSVTHYTHNLYDLYFTSDKGISIELTGSGNNIRQIHSFGRTHDVNSDAYSTVTESVPTATYKYQTGEKGYGLTNVDIVMYYQADVNNTSNTLDITVFDFTNDITEIAIPVPPATNLTTWTKACDFSGGSQHLKQVSSNSGFNPLRMSSLGQLVTAPTNLANTSASTYSRPWACATVFTVDGNSSNQHIWNLGEGAGSTDDNIYIRLTSSRELFFGWGRIGALNELYIGTLSTSLWYGLYIGHNGTRLSGSNATATNLANCFDVYLMNSGNSFGGYTSYSTSSQWSHSNSSVGGRMDRTILGDFSIGGRAGNRNFHGKVASFVSTTLRLNQAMPTSTEAQLMITDPKKWEDDYRVGKTVRYSNGTGEGTYNPSNSSIGYGAVQMWLMGNGTSDNYSNGIRNDIYPSDQNYTKLTFINMVSSDIETVNINGLT